jgi:hypothetical protein
LFSHTPLASWNALVAGRWSIVDAFDSDGRRLIVARASTSQPARDCRPSLAASSK